MTRRTVERTYEIVGVPIRVTADDDAVEPLLDRVCGDLDPSSDDPVVTISIRSEGEGYRVWVDDTVRSDLLAFDQSFMKAMSLLHEQTMEHCALWAVHAGVVSRGGSVLAMPGKSGTGKSTLVAACVAAGWGYVSDEALAFDDDTMEVVAYPKPIWIDRRATRLVGVPQESLAVTPSRYKYPVTPADLGGVVARGPLRLRAVVVPERTPDTAGPELVPMRRAELVTVLLRHTFKRTREPETKFERAVAVARRIDGYRLSFSTTKDAVEILDGVLS